MRTSRSAQVVSTAVGLAAVLCVSAACGRPVSFASADRSMTSHLSADLYKPDGPGPFPAIVLLHGCGGVSRTHTDWAAKLQTMGYVALLVDSFSPRGHREICTDFSRVPRVQRVHDAYGALRYLKAQPFVDGRRIGLMGWSNGGYVVLDVVRIGRADDYDLAGEGFRAAVALYPECRFDIGAVFAVPLLVLIGGADDWTLASSCDEMAKISLSREQVSLKIYPGANHSFDAAGTPVHFLANVRLLWRHARLGPRRSR